MTTPDTMIGSPFKPVERYRMRVATAPSGAPIINSCRMTLPGGPLISAGEAV
jgi:hypothetical protein